MRENVTFEPSARLQSILSRELVADPNVAVIEFVKNAYDAGGRRVQLDFALQDSARDGVLTIADDGEGMDLAEFKQNWMRPGYSEKATEEYKPRRGRIPAGEKGLGRLAAGRLGEFLDVWTRKKKSARWLHARFKWADFEDMDQALSEIQIPIDDETEPDVTVGDTGTVVQISGLRLNWDGKVPGRKSPGRHPTRIGRLRQDLEMLLLPLSTGDDDFEIWVSHNSSQAEDEPPGRVEAPFLELIHYRYDFEVRPRGRGWEVKRTIRRGTELLDDDVSKEQGLKAQESSRERLEPPSEGATLSEVGRFSGSLLYAPDSADRLQNLRAPVGVLLYRDGLRVEPYGQPGNDWLGAQAKKASRQGYAAIQPAALYGAVRISRAENPHLRSQANREGLIENDAYESFIQICRGEFERFEQIVFDEYLEPHWQTTEERRRKDALATQNYSVSLTRALMHSVSQPVATANATLDRFQTLISKLDDAGLRHELQDLHDQTAGQLSRIGGAIGRVLDVVDFDPAPTRFDLAKLVREIAREGTSPSAEVSLRLSRGLTVNLPEAPVREALGELLANAATAPRANGTGPEVRISAKRSEENGVEITVSDNGTGVEQKVRDDLFKRATSTKGHIGMGLIITRQLLHVIGGEVELESSGAQGTNFVVTLPKEAR